VAVARQILKVLLLYFRQLLQLVVVKAQQQAQQVAQVVQAVAVLISMLVVLELQTKVMQAAVLLTTAVAVVQVQ
jgi:hypothetical protein